LFQLPFISAAPTLSTSPSFNHNVAARAAQVDSESPNDPRLWLNLGVSAALVLSGGAFAGLTIALMGQVCLLPLLPFSCWSGL
jgi:metal transporter CNNM